MELLIGDSTPAPKCLISNTVKIAGNIEPRWIEASSENAFSAEAKDK